jgi:DnaK suppressor protein
MLIMQDSDKQKLRQLIADELLNLEDHIKELEVRCRPISPDNAIGRLSRMEAIGEQGVQQMALDAARLRQSELKRAIERMDADPDFGLCENCDQPIPLARLMLMPESCCCVQCLQSAE